MPVTISDRVVAGPSVGMTAGQRLESPVRHVMTPGVVTIVEDASLNHLHRAMLAHGVHALLVVPREGGKPLGWVTARALLSWVERDSSVACARDAVSEQPTMVDPDATVREAIRALSSPDVTHLLVGRENWQPEGVVSDINLIAWTRD